MAVAIAGVFAIASQHPLQSQAPSIAVLRVGRVPAVVRIAYRALGFGGRLKSSLNVVTAGASSPISATPKTTITTTAIVTAKRKEGKSW